MFNKKIIIVVIFIAVISFGFLFYQHNQLPSIKDVYASTKNWSGEINKVHAIANINNEWIVFFEMQEYFYVSKLEKNWIGNWKVVDWHGKEGTIGSAMVNTTNNYGVIWGVTEVSNEVRKEYISFFYGMINNPAIDEVVLETVDSYMTIDLIHSNGNRYFFVIKEGIITQFSLKAFSNGIEIANYGGL